MTNPMLVAFLALLPFIAFPLLVLAANGHLRRTMELSWRKVLMLGIMIIASLHAYVSADEKEQPPEPPEPPPGPYIPGGTWETRLHRNPFTGSLKWTREYRLPPSAPDIPIVSEEQ